jgi:hypothetical protein
MNQKQRQKQDDAGYIVGVLTDIRARCRRKKNQIYYSLSQFARHLQWGPGVSLLKVKRVNSENVESTLLSNQGRNIWRYTFISPCAFLILHLEGWLCYVVLGGAIIEVVVAVVDRVHAVLFVVKFASPLERKQRALCDLRQIISSSERREERGKWNNPDRLTLYASPCITCVIKSRMILHETSGRMDVGL